MLDGGDTGVTIALASTTIDFSRFRGDPDGTDLLTVAGNRALTAADFYLA